MEQEINRVKIEAQLNALAEQRNAAMNNVIALVGELALRDARIKELESSNVSN